MGIGEKKGWGKMGEMVGVREGEEGGEGVGGDEEGVVGKGGGWRGGWGGVN